MSRVFAEGQTYFQNVFDNWNDAVSYQADALLHCIGNGWPIRAAEIAVEKDFATQKQSFMVLVRPFVIDDQRKAS